MGRPFIDHMGGIKIISCKKCDAPLTNKENLESGNFQGSTGKAYLFTRAVNVKYGEVIQRQMMTGLHFVRDVYCKQCNEKLGWMYEYACPTDQKHKEGKVIFEKSFILESKSDYP